MFWVTPPSVIAVSVLLPLLACTAVGLRFYVRRVKHVGLGVDDWLVLAGVVFAIGCAITLIYGAAAGGLAQPTPTADSPAPGLPGYMFALNDALVLTWKCKFAFNLIQMLAFGAVKLSVIYFYRRIFRGKVFDICSKIMIGLVVLWTVGFFFTVLFQCGTDFWALDGTLFTFLSHCLQDVVYLESNLISHILLDILILTIPAPMIWRLQLSTSRKIALCAVFFIGFLAVAAGVARLTIFLVFLSDSFSQSQGIMVMTIYLYWTMIELSISIVAACLPTLKPALNTQSFRRLSDSLQSLFSSHHDSSLGEKTQRGSESGGSAPSIGSVETAREAVQEWHQFQKKIAGGELGTSIEAMHVPDVETGLGGIELPDGKIFVESDIQSRYSSK